MCVTTETHSWCTNLCFSFNVHFLYTTHTHTHRYVFPYIFIQLLVSRLSHTLTSIPPWIWNINLRSGGWIKDDSRGGVEGPALSHVTKIKTLSRDFLFLCVFMGEVSERRQTGQRLPQRSIFSLQSLHSGPRGWQVAKPHVQPIRRISKMPGG